MSEPTPPAPAPTGPAWPRWLAAALVLALIVAVVASGVLRPERLLERRAELQALAADHPALSAAVFLAGGAALMGLSVPVATLLSLAAGMLFGLVEGVVLMSLASTAGATLAFLSGRYLFREAARRRFARWTAVVDRGVEREGAFYLFALRLNPAVPFAVLNVTMGLTAMRARTFWWVSQVGMLPGTILYVNAGTRLGEVADLKGLASPWLLGSFLLLGLAPLGLKWLAGWLRGRGGPPGSPPGEAGAG